MWCWEFDVSLLLFLCVKTKKKTKCEDMTSTGFSLLSHVLMDCPQPALRDDDSSISNVCVWTVAEWCLSLVGLMWVVIDQWLTRHPQQIMKSYAVLVFAVFLWRLWIFFHLRLKIHETIVDGLRKWTTLCCVLIFLRNNCFFLMAGCKGWTWRNSMPHVTLRAD